MKFICSALWIALGSTAVAAGPVAAPVKPLAAASAASAERLELARQFVNLALPPERYMKLMRAGAASGFASSLARLKNEEGDETADEGEEVQAEGKAYLDRYFARLEPVMKAQLPTLAEAYAAAYAREYSTPELQQMIAFARTPSGQHYLSRRDFVDLDPDVLRVQMKMFDSFGPVLKQMQKEACQEHTAQRIAAGDKNAKCPLSDKPDTLAG